MKKWKAKLPDGKTLSFESDSPREYMRDAGYSAYALEQAVPKQKKSRQPVEKTGKRQRK